MCAISLFQEDYEYSTNDAVVYETIDDANISTTSCQPNSNDDDDDDETTESLTQSYGIESFDCTDCGEIQLDQKSLDAHLRIVSIPRESVFSINCLSFIFFLQIVHCVRFTTKWSFTNVHIVLLNFLSTSNCWNILTFTLD